MKESWMAGTRDQSHKKHAALLSHDNCLKHNIRCQIWTQMAELWHEMMMQACNNSLYTLWFSSPLLLRVVKGIFVTRDRPFFPREICEMAIFFLVNRDFHSSREAWFCKIIFRETRNKCLVFVIFDNRYYIVNDTAWLWHNWMWFCFFSVSTIMAEAHQRNVRDHQNVTVLIIFFLSEGNKNYWFTRRNLVFRFLPGAAHRDFEIFKKAMLDFCGVQSLTEAKEFAPVEREEQPKFSKEEGREGALTSRDHGYDQLSEFEYGDVCSDNESDDFTMEEDGAIRDMLNSELCFLFASRRKWQQPGWLCFRLEFSKCNGM